MLRLIYTAALYVAAPLALAVTALRGVRDPSYRGRLGERWGLTRVRFATSPIWVHAVSVGEVQAAAVLIRALRERYPQHPLLITTATPTGAQRVTALFGEYATHAYLPYDLPGAVARFLDRVKPRIGIVMEREIWPNLFVACERRAVPVVLASARMSASSARRQQKLARLFAPALARNVIVAAQTEADAARYCAIGADPSAVHVAGNIKFDLQVAETVRNAGEALRARQFANRPVWVAGSTHEGEEEIVLAAHERLRNTFPDALLILAPRHPTRFVQAASWLKARGVSFAQRSSNGAVTARDSVLLADTLGELVMLYAAGDAAFVGGSLVPIGGHNLLEPAALSKAIVVGPYNFNAQDVAQMFLEAGAAIEVADAGQLADALVRLLSDSAGTRAIGAKGRGLLDANRGALERTLQLIDPLLIASARV